VGFAEGRLGLDNNFVYMFVITGYLHLEEVKLGRDKSKCTW